MPRDGRLLTVTDAAGRSEGAIDLVPEVTLLEATPAASREWRFGRVMASYRHPLMTSPPKVDLSRYSPGDYQPGPLALRVLWYAAAMAFFETRIPWPSRFKAGVLRWFGARVGEGVVLKPRLRIKYPWFLSLGDHVWLGEEVWIDNLAMVRIESHACLSQGTCVLTGNHDYESPGFDLRLGPVGIGVGAWIGAKCVVCPGVELGDHAVVHAGSVAKGRLEAGGIFAGNPAGRIGDREIRS